jgi:hypothetical protein
MALLDLTGEITSQDGTGQSAVPSYSPVPGYQSTLRLTVT